MDFTLSDEQQMLREASRDLLSDRCTPGAVRAILDTAEMPPKLWALGADLGWAGLALPEAHGGSGQGLTELALVAEELGRSIARTPFLPTVLVGAALTRGAEAELQAQTLPALADGSALGAWAVAETGRPWGLTGVQATATADGADFVLSGTKTLVQDAHQATWLLVTVLLDGIPTCFLVDRSADGVTVRRQQVLDPTRILCEVQLSAVRVPADRRLSLTPEQIQRLLDDAAVLTAADALGSGRHLLAMTVEYAGLRHQFGRAIGSFQAVKHKCATMSIQLQGAHATTYYAAMAADAQTADASRAASVAKAFTSEAMSSLAGEALQVHGGIGFTWEHDLHLYLRRIKSDAVLYGDVPQHQERLCALLEHDRAAAS